jgi:ATP-binding cassette, subfamily B, bacterial
MFIKRILKENALGHLVSVMWEHAEGNRRIIIGYTAMAIVAVLAGLSCPLAMTKVMESVSKEHGDALLSSSGQYIALYTFLSLGFWVFHGPSRVIETIIAYRIRRAMQVSLCHKVTLLPMRWHKQNHSGVIIDQVAKASTALSDFAKTGFEVTHIMVRFFGAIGFLTLMFPWAGIAVLGFSLVIGYVIMCFDRTLTKEYAAQNKGLNEVAASIQDYLTNVSTVISLRLEDRVAREIDARARTVSGIWRQTATRNELKWFSSSILIDFMHGGVLFGFLLYYTGDGRPTEVATVFALGEYLRSVADAFFRFTCKYGDLLTKSARVRAIDHIEEAYEREIKASEGAILPSHWKRVEIKDLSFTHDEETGEGRLTGVRRVSFALERGKSYALVGESGSGKSTVLKLLRGLHHAESGVVLCDGARMPHGMNHIAHHSTLIPQEPEIFADTIRFNVAMGVETSDEAILWALERARFSPVLKKLPRGLDEKGVSLSGGEKQRLAVARGLFFAKESGSEIVLLDEPTSSVDIVNERHIYEGLLREFKDLCVVTAIHKFNLLGLFDEVLVFANGELVERGTVRELLARRGEFSRLSRSFSEGSKIAAQ